MNAPPRYRLATACAPVRGALHDDELDGGQDLLERPDAGDSPTICAFAILTSSSRLTTSVMPARG
jgi:hypothetical protein